jgi:ABC-type transport system involved in multi-copper enzyme maturation permease subunit
MLTLLKLEWYKFKSNSVINLLLGLFLLLFPILILGGKDLFENVPPPLPSNTVFYEFPTVWDYQGYIGNWMIFFFLGFAGIFIVTSEVSFKTLRQNIIIGLTRREYFTAKVLTIIVISVIATFIYALSALLIGLANTPGADFALIVDNNWAISKFFLLAMGYLSFGLMIGFLIRKSGIAIFLYMTYIMFLEPILKFLTIGLFTWQWEKQGILSEMLQDESPILNIVNYLPMNLIEDLHPNPFLRLPDNFLRFNNEINYSVLLPQNHAIIGSIIYIGIFIFLSYRSFMKKDI